MKWFYWNKGAEVGPLTEPALRELQAAGILSPETPVRPENSGEWTTFAELDGPAARPNPARATPPEQLQAARPAPPKTKRNKIIWIIAGASAMLAVIAGSVILAAKGAYDKAMVSGLLKEADRIAFQTEGERDWEHAVSLLKAAVEKGNHEAEYKLGTCYLFGRGVSQDKAEAVRYFLLSSTGGYAEAQYNLAVCYAKGEGVDRNEEEMLKWLKLSANQNFKQAQFFLGKLYLDGQAVPQNTQRGLDLLNAAAAQGLVEAQFDLSLYYEFGKVVPKDMVEAYKWAIISIRSGITRGDEAEGQEILGKLRSQMTDAQISEAESLANEWRPEATQK